MALADRQSRILHALVDEYVDTAEPVSSDWLANRYDFGCKSATLRNEMAEMAENGYLVQPHTSSGRVPTRLGYRYYVDWLMPAAGTLSDTPLPEPDLDQLGVDEIVQRTCRLLSNMTLYPSVASPPTCEDTTIHRVYLSAAGPRHMLLVLLLSTGHVENRVLEVERAPGQAALQRVTNFLNDLFAECPLTDAVLRRIGEAPADLRADTPLVLRAHAALLHAVRSLTDNRVFLEGTSHMLRQREFHNVLLLEQLLLALERKSALFEVFSTGMAASDVTVIIGVDSEDGLQDCSVVTSPYRIGDRTSGFIGVFGPTRMRYDRTVAAVDLMARSLSTLLTDASLR